MREIHVQTHTINISIKVNNLLHTNPLSLTLSSLVNFDKEESKIEKKKCLCVCGGEGSGEHTDTKTVCQNCVS